MTLPKTHQGFAAALFDLDSPHAAGAVLYQAGAITAASQNGPSVELTFPWSRLDSLHGLPAYRPAESTPPAEGRLRLTALGDEILRLTLATEDQETTGPMLEFAGDLKPLALRAETSVSGWRILDADGRLRAFVDHTPPVLNNWNKAPAPAIPAPARFRLTLLPDGRTPVPFNSADFFGGWKHDSLPLCQTRQNDRAERSGFALKADPGECFGGTGERFAKMDLSGQTLRLENQDGLGVNNRNTYKNVPFYLSSRGYGLFIHTSDHLRLSLAGVSTRSVMATVEHPGLDLFFLGGAHPARVLHNYRRVTGFPARPPLWSYGTWMSRMTYFSAEEVNAIARRLREEDYPCDVLHLDTGWFAKDWICEWSFNTDKFPDPAGFMQALRRDGFRVTLWQTPYIGKGNRLLEEARAKGYLGRPRDEASASSGSDFSGQQIGGHIDFSNPEAVAWYQGMLRKLLELGASAIKTDFGEDIVAADYRLPLAKLHNRYALLYQQAAFEVTRELTGDSIIWARAGWAGCQRYPLHWGGDAECSWDGLVASLRGGLHLGLSGFAFWSHDVPGFHGTPDFMHSMPPDDLYVRWTQFGVLSSHLRYHGTTPREPWEFPAVADIVRRWLRLRYALIPYLIDQAEAICRGGLPMLQALWLRHPTDIGCRHIDDQYYLGEHLLVAPVANSEGLRDVYLPPLDDGDDTARPAWIDLWTGQTHTGGRWLRGLRSPLSTIPVFVRAGARIPVYPEAVASTAHMDLGKVRELVFDETYRGLASSPIAYADPRVAATPSA